MTNMQRLVLVLGIVFAVLLGILLATTFLGGGSSGPAAATSSPPASASSAPSGAVTSPSGAVTSPGASSSEAPSGSAGPSASPTPSPIPNATVTFVGLKLDAASDTAGLDRVITWTTGSGSITAQYASPKATGSAKACLYGAGKLLGCHSGSSGKLSARTTKSKESFKLTIRGVSTATPVINVTLAFPAASPSVKIQNARFDGTGYPDTNGLQVVATPQVAGSYRVQASWGGHPFQYEVDLIEQGGPGLQTLTNQGPSVSVDQSFTVTPTNPWMIVLKNSEEGFGITGLTATFSWP